MDPSVAKGLALIAATLEQSATLWRTAADEFKKLVPAPAARTPELPLAPSTPQHIFVINAN